MGGEEGAEGRGFGGGGVEVDFGDEARGADDVVDSGEFEVEGSREEAFDFGVRDRDQVGCRESCRGG